MSPLPLGCSETTGGAGGQGQYMEVSFQHSLIPTYFLCSRMGYPWTAAPLRDVPAPAWVSHRPPSLRGVPALAQVTDRPSSFGSIPALGCPSKACFIQHRVPPFKRVHLQHVPSNVAFHVLLPQLSSMSPPPSPSVTPPFVHPPVSPPMPPPVSPAPSSYCLFLNVSKQQHHVLLWQVEVLAYGRLFSSMPELAVTAQGGSQPPPTLGAFQPPAAHDPIKHKYTDCGDNSQKNMRYVNLMITTSYLK